MYEDLVEKFYTRNERIRKNTRDKIKYTGKGVRIKTNMITYWKQNPKFPQETKNRHKNRPHWLKNKNEKNHKKQQSQKTSVPMFLRKQKKWKYPREEKDTYEYISQEKV